MTNGPVNQSRIHPVKHMPEPDRWPNHGQAIELIEPESIDNEIVEAAKLEEMQARSLWPKPIEVERREPTGNQDQDHQSHKGDREDSAACGNARFRGDDRRHYPLEPSSVCPARQHSKRDSDNDDHGQDKERLAQSPR